MAATLPTEAPVAGAFADQLETARLRMRLFTPDDFDRMCEITSDPEVTRFIGYGVPLTREETLANLGRILDGFRRRGFGRWALERRDTGALIGYCGLSAGNPEMGIEIAYMLAREEWGQGFALEAGHASLRYGFEAVGVESIAGLTFHDNRRSRGVLERLGMKFIRDAHYYDFTCVHYAIARADWSPDGSHYRVIKASGQ
ncbi:MAG TPA: GNAT family N-acetyltransferase [Pyrinomonadaceae bacterium]